MLNNTLERLRAMRMSAFASELERQMEDADSYGQLAFLAINTVFTIIA